MLSERWSVAAAVRETIAFVLEVDWKVFDAVHVQRVAQVGALFFNEEMVKFAKVLLDDHVELKLVYLE